MFENVFYRSRPGICQLVYEAHDGRPLSTGTEFLFNGKLVTCCHVAHGATANGKVRIKFGPSVRSKRRLQSKRWRTVSGRSRIAVAAHLASVCPMLKVADFNVLHSSELTGFLRASPENRIIVTDNMATECLKRDGTANFRQSFNLLQEFCDRVVVLRPFKEARRLPPRASGFREALIDTNKTLNFPGLCRRFRAGDPETLAIIEDQQLKNQDFVTKLRQLVDQHLRAAFNEFNVNAGKGGSRNCVKMGRSMLRNATLSAGSRTSPRWKPLSPRFLASRFPTHQTKRVGFLFDLMSR